MGELTRRDFLAGAATATAAVGLAACTGSTTNASDGGVAATTATTRPAGLPAPADAPFDTVVVLMQENRSFDHMLGWLPGANGKQEGLTFVDAQGQTHPTWPMAPDWQGCELQDPFHFWQAMAAHYADGACDGFLKTQPANDQFPIGYYREGDLPVLSALAKHYTTFDNYFCSMLGPTWPNRLYQLCATTDLDITGLYPEGGAPRPVQLQTAIFDRVRAAGLTTGYYTWGEPMTGLFASQRYDDITYPIDKFWTDAAAGKLPNVTFVDPDYTGHAELNGTSNDYHPYGSVQVAEAYVAQVHDALAHGPQWERMVFVLNFDENGGFYDTVPPPAVQDDTVIPGGGPQPDLKRLGFRVPAIAMGPFAPQKIDHSGPYEHCSVLKMIEWRWNLQPMAMRDRLANNLAESLDFSLKRPPLDLAPFTPTPAQICTNTNHFG